MQTLRVATASPTWGVGQNQTTRGPPVFCHGFHLPGFHFGVARPIFDPPPTSLPPSRTGEQLYYRTRTICLAWRMLWPDPTQSQAEATIASEHGYWSVFFCHEFGKTLSPCVLQMNLGCLPGR